MPFTFDDVSVSFGSTEALTRIDLELPSDGISVILGPSGSGKSTLLRLCNRLDVPTSGRVLFRRSAVADLDPLALRRRVGMVFQRPTPFPGTCAHNLAVADPSLSHQEMCDLMTRAELDPDLLDRETAGLSGGEAQRLCLARTLAARPEAILMDEPTSALDDVPKRRLEALARRLAGDGVPVVWVTHDLDQGRRLADHVVVVIGGRLRGAGSYDAVASGDDAASRFLSGFDDAR